MPETVEEISKKPEVREELARTAGREASRRDRSLHWPAPRSWPNQNAFDQELFAALNAAPEKVMFPAGANR